MKINYSHSLSKKLESERAIKRFYSDIANRIIVVISILEGADNLEMVPNIPPTRRHKLTGDYDGCWAVDVSKNRRLIIRALDGDEPKIIKEVELLDIIDYH